MSPLKIIIFGCLMLAASSGLAWAGPLESLELGNVEGARLEATRTSDAESYVVRAALAIRDGDFEKAEELANTASLRANRAEIRDAATIVRAELQEARGEFEDAERLLRSVLKERPQATAARLRLGRLLIESGRTREGEVLLDAFSAFYNNGLLKTSADLARLGEAMWLLGSFQDANHAFQEAVDADPKNVAAQVRWAALFLDKYNTADAERTLNDALKKVPNQPDALVYLARTELLLSNDYNKIRNLLDRAAMVEPHHPEMQLVHARVAIYDADCERARTHANEVLELRPKELGALTVLAACAYLDDDAPAFAKAKKRVLDIHPTYAPLLTETAEYAVREHRYDEAVGLYRDALKLRPDDPAALLGLGIGLSRVGKEDEALDVLRRAFDADPYNVRAYNMVELYEKVMPDYEFHDHGRYRVRAHQQEHEAIDALVSPVVAESMDVYDAKYRMKPAPYLAVEVFPSSEAFGVRSVGLPHVAPHGICFGKVVTTRSPSEGNFNWRAVVWHEMAHVYHIQISHGRVPRWFTEGLAEYETNIKDPAWSRYHDRELYRGLLSGELRGVLDLDKGFTQARSFEEILRSYHQASLVIHYLAETYGFDKLVQMLEAWGAKKDHEEVYRGVLGVAPEAIDNGFEAWLHRRYFNFKGQLMVDLASVGSARDEEAAVADAGDDEAFQWAKVAVARMRDGDQDGARVALERGLKAKPTDPRVQHVAMLFDYDAGSLRDAYEHGNAILATAHDSYDLRLILGRAAHQLEKLDEAAIHYRAATQLWPNGVEAWSALQRIAKRIGDEALADRALKRVFELEQGDPVVARLYGNRSLEKRDAAGVAEAGKRWVDVAPFDGRSHEMRAEAALLRGDDAAAEDAWELWIAVRKRDEKDVLVKAIEAATTFGRESLAARMAKRATRAGVSERRVARALGKR